MQDSIASSNRAQSGHSSTFITYNNIRIPSRSSYSQHKLTVKGAYFSSPLANHSSNCSSNAVQRTNFHCRLFRLKPLPEAWTTSVYFSSKIMLLHDSRQTLAAGAVRLSIRHCNCYPALRPPIILAKLTNVRFSKLRVRASYLQQLTPASVVLRSFAIVPTHLRLL